ncbi:unnamed protein product [Bemisia tabaci]|uniref:G-protein coupled receptors family 1 profile domain-containing protein n=1 Tax=Bemisia tabaci TaxID=7038 RepID=A0A9P0AMW2_BEMTA|nr:unnamed protein product [Bemisia tabaci]
MERDFDEVELLPANLTVCSHEEEHWFRDNSRQIIQRFLVPFVVAVGVMGNLITILVLTRRRMSSSTNNYLSALAVADLLYLLFHFTLSLKHYPGMSAPDKIIYWTYRPYVLWLTDATNAASIWLTVSFTLERYIAVCHPLRGRMSCTESRARKVIVLVFVLCLLLTASTPFEHLVSVCLNSNGTKELYLAATTLAQNKHYRSFYFSFTTIVMIFIPIFLLGICNIFLVSAVHRSKSKRPDLTQDRGHSNYRQNQENKITLTLVMVVSLFIICQAPTAILLIYQIFVRNKPNSNAFNIELGLGNIFNFLVCVNSASNFILYCIMSDKYRRTLMMTLVPCLAKTKKSRTFSSLASFRNSTRHNHSTCS